MKLNRTMKRKTLRGHGTSTNFSLWVLTSFRCGNAGLDCQQKTVPHVHHRCSFLMQPWCRMTVIKGGKHRPARQGVAKRADDTNCKSRVESGLMQVLLRDILDYKTVTQRMTHAWRDVFGISLLFLTMLCFFLPFLQRKFFWQSLKSFFFFTSRTKKFEPAIMC